VAPLRVEGRVGTRHSDAMLLTTSDPLIIGASGRSKLARGSIGAVAQLMYERC
jgi:hypothetical protein